MSNDKATDKPDDRRNNRAHDKHKVLVVLTNTTRYGNTAKLTGLWLSEATEFVAIMQRRSIKVDYASPKGGFVPLDPRSMRHVNKDVVRVYESADFQQRALADSLGPDRIRAEDYDAIYFTGGHGVMWDFPESDALQHIAATIYGQGGFVTSVCHGIAGLLNIPGEHGGYLISGKHVTGFTSAEEMLAGKMHLVPFLNERVAEERGAKFVKRLPYTPFAVSDGRFITGQNPFSAKAVANQLARALNQA